MKVEKLWIKHEVIIFFSLYNTSYMARIANNQKSQEMGSVGSDCLLKLHLPGQFWISFEKNKGILDHGMFVPTPLWKVSVLYLFT